MIPPIKPIINRTCVCGHLRHLHFGGVGVCVMCGCEGYEEKP